MKRKGKSEKIFWVISIIVVVSMVGSTLLIILESCRPPSVPAPSGWLSPTGAVEIVADAPGWTGSYGLYDMTASAVWRGCVLPRQATVL